jgi:HD-GYP domain-containing protein (c-di-GMP phosphodiesterase class II)
MSSRKRLSVGDLQVGMIASKEIVCNNKVLIAKGVAINEAAINKLKEQYFYNQVEVYIENDADSKKREEMEVLEETFVKLSADMEALFKKIDKLDAEGLEEVRSFANRIKTELNAPGNIIKNILMNGSGEDAVYRHGVNVAAISGMLGKWLGFDGNQLNHLIYAAILHDFGKTKIDNSILFKKNTLTKAEVDVLKKHPVVSYDSITKMPFLDKNVIVAVIMHHEREDGSGYPFGLKGDKIHPFSKIIAIADVFDAINSSRIYRKKLLPFESLKIIYKESLDKLNFEYCSVFLNHITNFYVGESVLLNDDTECKIIKFDVNNIDKPLVFNGSDFIDLKTRNDLFIKEILI